MKLPIFISLGERESREILFKSLTFLILFLFWFSSPTPYLKILLSFLLLFLLPGFFVLRFINTTQMTEVILFSIIFGFIIQILLAYILSLLKFSFLDLSLFVLSFLLWIFSPTIPSLKPSDKKPLFLLSLIFLFHLIMYLYPSSETVRNAWRDVGFLPVGDDSKHHLLIVKSILNERKIPTSYYLYPNIPLVYPAGYHVIISILYYFSSFDLLKLMFFFPLFSLLLLTLSSFTLASRIFDKQTGYVSSLLIPSIPQTMIMVTYGNSPQLLSLSFLFASLTLLFHKGAKGYLLPIIFSSNFYLSPYSFFISIVTIFLFLLINRRFLNLAIFLITTSVFFIPFYLFLYTSFSNSVINPFQNIPKYELINLWYFNLPERVNIEDIILFLRPLNESIIAIGLLAFFLIKERRTLYFFIFFFLSIIILLFVRRAPTLFSGLTLGLENVLFSLSDTRALFLIFYPFSLLFSSLLSKLKLKRIFIILFLTLLLLPIHLERENIKLDYQLLTLGDWEYIKFVNETIPRDTTIYNDYYRGTITNSLSAFIERKVSYPFIFYPFIEIDGKILDFDGRREIVRIIPNSELALNILKKENATYLTFSTGFNLTSSFGFSVPTFNPNTFKQCYEKVYGNYSNWIFKINYNCTPFMYLPLFITCKDICLLPESLKIELPTIIEQFRIFLITKVQPSNIFYPIGFTEVFQNEEKIASWPMIKMNRKFLFIAELDPKEKIELKFKGERPYIKDLMIVAEINGTNISLAKNVYSAFFNNKDILIFNPNQQKIKLVMVYNDTNGNAYFNLLNFSSKNWISVGEIERKQTYKPLKSEVELSPEKFALISIASFDSPLEILHLKILPLSSIFLDAEVSWVGEKLVKIEELDLFNLHSLSSNIHLRGSWIVKNDKVVLPPNRKDCQVLLSRLPPLFTLKITYLDKGKNEININYWDNVFKEWKTLFAFNTTDSKKVKEVSIPLYSPKEGAILNFYSWEEEFEILNITIES